MIGVALSLALTTSAVAQIRASERATVAQTVDGTVITVEYSRPQGRGRRELFGARGKGVVHWGEMWTPGANWATTSAGRGPCTCTRTPACTTRRDPRRTPSRPAAGLPAEALAPYLGSYTATMTGDSTVMPVEVVGASGVLRAVFEGKFPFTWELIPTDEPHRFMPAFLDKGKVFDVEDAAPFIFELEAGRVVAFRVMGIEEVWLKGKRRG